ncbi:hypothetical protein OIO90_002811 [Microbotryomycetes sp. JL221]|nr:hypothetical protein OIO90_002811 [Microbotryomycetes sp. JL221]
MTNRTEHDAAKRLVNDFMFELEDRLSYSASYLNATHSWPQKLTQRHFVDLFNSNWSHAALIKLEHDLLGLFSQTGSHVVVMDGESCLIVHCGDQDAASTILSRNVTVYTGQQAFNLATKAEAKRLRMAFCSVIQTIDRFQRLTKQVYHATLRTSQLKIFNVACLEQFPASAIQHAVSLVTEDPMTIDSMLEVGPGSSLWTGMTRSQKSREKTVIRFLRESNLFVSSRQRLNLERASEFKNESISNKAQLHQQPAHVINYHIEFINSLSHQVGSPHDIPSHATNYERALSVLLNRLWNLRQVLTQNHGFLNIEIKENNLEIDQLEKVFKQAFNDQIVSKVVDGTTDQFRWKLMKRAEKTVDDFEDDLHQQIDKAWDSTLKIYKLEREKFKSFVETLFPCDEKMQKLILDLNVESIDTQTIVEQDVRMLATLIRQEGIRQKLVLKIIRETLAAKRLEPFDNLYLENVTELSLLALIFKAMLSSTWSKQGQSILIKLQRFFLSTLELDSLSDDVNLLSRIRVEYWLFKRTVYNVLLKNVSKFSEVELIEAFENFQNVLKGLIEIPFELSKWMSSSLLFDYWRQYGHVLKQSATDVLNSVKTLWKYDQRFERQVPPDYLFGTLSNDLKEFESLQHMISFPFTIRPPQKDPKSWSTIESSIIDQAFKVLSECHPVYGFQKDEMYKTAINLSKILASLSKSRINNRQALEKIGSLRTIQKEKKQERQDSLIKLYQQEQHFFLKMIQDWPNLSFRLIFDVSRLFIEASIDLNKEVEHLNWLQIQINRVIVRNKQRHLYALLSTVSPSRR